MAEQTKATTDHREIRSWVEDHDGRPAAVQDTEQNDEVGVLRIDFPGSDHDRSLEQIGWDEWFEKFDSAELAFLYQAQKADGEDSTFFKLIRRD